ncbi:LysE family translocator [Peribacillus acanthi]|uniref:LysE family translocator n=1 Tax=Peribacillus acanthi TaxID=2171554 RepID=UPI000D3E2A26|nr:LysE family transporter [Peribacillus acanthi]
MLFLKSFLLGFSVSAPVGPIGLLCIQRTLVRGKWAGFLTGLGAVSANMIYASIAAFGFSVVSAFLLEQQFILRVVGGLFLFYLGVKTFLKKPTDQVAILGGESLLAMYFSTFFLMITNPVTILNFVAMFAGLGFEKSSHTGISALLMVGGVFWGATSWWLILSFGVSLFRNKITPHLSIVNKIAGLLIILLGMLAFIK